MAYSWEHPWDKNNESSIRKIGEMSRKIRIVSYPFCVMTTWNNLFSGTAINFTSFVSCLAFFHNRGHWNSEWEKKASFMEWLRIRVTSLVFPPSETHTLHCQCRGKRHWTPSMRPAQNKTFRNKTTTYAVNSSRLHDKPARELIYLWGENFLNLCVSILAR